jgi:hypothetical protein
MRDQFQRWMVALACAALIGFAADQARSSISLGGTLGKVLKVAGIATAVRMFGPEINKTINTLLAQRGLSYEGATKVVPSLSIGRGAYIGAAQVQGAKSFVDDVRAVGQAETRAGDIELQLLIPLNTSTPTKGYKKIEGVGVSSLIDFEI